jgi:hypothetical protein
MSLRYKLQNSRKFAIKRVFLIVMILLASILSRLDVVFEIVEGISVTREQLVLVEIRKGIQVSLTITQRMSTGIFRVENIPQGFGCLRYVRQFVRQQTFNLPIFSRLSSPHDINFKRSFRYPHLRCLTQPLSNMFLSFLPKRFPKFLKPLRSTTVHLLIPFKRLR